MNDKKIAVLVSAVLIVGFIWGVNVGSGGEKKLAPIIEYYQQLKQVDDQGFGLASEAMGICGDMVVAAVDRDASMVQYHTSRLEGVTNQVKEVSDKREEILKKIENQ